MSWRIREGGLEPPSSPPWSAESGGKDLASSQLPTCQLCVLGQVSFSEVWEIEVILVTASGHDGLKRDSF